jgi:N-acetylmuramoyl-L-alanine amidase
MAFPFVQAFHDLGLRGEPVLGFTIHMAEGGGTVGFLQHANPHGVSVHYVIEDSGRIVQMLLESHMHTSIRIKNKDGSNAIRQGNDPNGFFGHGAAVAVLGDTADTRTTLGPNNSTIAVEIEGFAKNGPNEDQKDALVALVTDVRTRFPRIGLLGHRDHNIKGGHGPAAGGEDMPGVESTLPQSLAVGKVTIPKGTVAIRVSNHAKFEVPKNVTRPAYRMQLAGGQSAIVYFVDLNGNVTHFVRDTAAGVTFVETP